MSIGSLFSSLVRKEELALVFDIGNASIGGAIVALSSKNLPTIIYSTRESFTISEKVNFEGLISALCFALDKVISTLGTEGVAHLALVRRGTKMPRTVFCVLAAPWYASHIRKTRLSDERPFEVTPEILSMLLEQEVESSGESQAQEYLRAGMREDKIRFIEKETIRIKLNGYDIPLPLHRMTAELEALFFLSVVPDRLLARIEERIKRFFTPRDIHFHSFMISFWSVMRDIWSAQKDFLLIDISGEITEIALVRDGAPLEVVTFPYARNFFIRKIMDAFRISADEAASLLSIHLSERGGGERNERLASIFLESRGKWLEYLKHSLLHLSEGLFLPELVFLMADEPLVSSLAEAVGSESLSAITPTRKPFIVETIGNKALSHFTKTTTAKQDNFLTVESLFANKLYSFRK